MFNHAKQWSTRPSQLVGLENGTYEAFCFDQAISYGGNAIQAELDAVELGKGKNAVKAREAKQQLLLQRLLFGKQQMAKTFRDPAERFRKKT